jgi:hypothetical protein
MTRIKLPSRLAIAVYLAVTALLWMAVTSASGCSSDNTNNANVDASTGVDGGSTADQTVSCSSGQTSCGGSCVNVKSDPHNCGTCGATCGTGLVCSNGQCAVGCGDAGTLCGVGTCANLNTDFDNCGSCGHVCSSGQTCSSGKCNTGGCTAPNTACNGSCVNTNTDSQNCGGCGKACTQGQVCAQGQCAFSCGTLTTCTSDAGPFCTNTQTDNTNCGSCGKVCPAGQVCTSGNCVVTCQPTQVNCGGNCIDPTTNNQYCGATLECGQDGGSGTPGQQCAQGQQCVNGVCTINCPPGQVACGSACIDPTTNNQYCGATPGCGVGDAGTAGLTCPLGTVCSSSSCASKCAQGYVLCNVLGVPTCINPLTDPTFCGAQLDCTGPNAGQICNAGDSGTNLVCAAGKCSSNCPTGQIICGTPGVCVDPQTNPSYCGASGNCSGVNKGLVCSGGTLCQGGNCSVTCAANEAVCGTPPSCVNPATNAQYCGAVIPTCNPPGKACSPGQICDAGACWLSCQTGLTNCNNVCVNLGTDRSNCGKCNNGCEAGTVCTGGDPDGGAGAACSLSCQTPEVNCLGNCINPNTDLVHCGAGANCSPTGTQCTAVQYCDGGGCASECTASQIPCPAGPNPTFCASYLSDNNNCGGCGIKCGVLEQCVATSPSSAQCFSTCLLDGGQIACGIDSGSPYCANDLTDNNNCGFCGNACNPSTTLTTCTANTGSASCQTECTAAQKACGTGNPGAFCASIKTDNNHCGDCNIACGALTNCQDGGCATTCGANQVPCGLDSGSPYCANNKTDNNNCGTTSANACGHKCNTLEVCGGGTCGTGCGAFTLCTSDAGAQSCVDLGSDTSNCGSCFHACGGGTPVCSASGAPNTGTCCATGQTSCSNGTCTNLQTDPNNCGSCGHRCGGNGNTACVAGVCPCDIATGINLDTYYVGNPGAANCATSLGLTGGWYSLNGTYKHLVNSQNDPVPSTQTCGTVATGYLTGTLPGNGQSANLTECFNYSTACEWSVPVQVANCGGNSFVYTLSSPPACTLGYCVE